MADSILRSIDRQSANGEVNFRSQSSGQDCLQISTHPEDRQNCTEAPKYRNSAHVGLDIIKSRVCLRKLMVVALMLFHLAPAHAAFFKGEALDTVANIVSWLAIVVAPITLITLFWLVHILPEKVAEKKKHPQAKAIQVLCLLSLVFGGLLWPIALLWAYSKPVLYRMAYGTDTAEHGPIEDRHPGSAPPSSGTVNDMEIESLRSKVAALEAQIAQYPNRV